MAIKPLFLISIVLYTFSIQSYFCYKFATLKNNKDWWKTAVIYQIYPRSFKDSNNDGIGDLQGIVEKLDYFVELGIDAIWMSPIFKSPMIDTGYDISDYRTIAPEYGTLDDFKNLLNGAHERNLKVILDFVPNHTSDLHEWFNKSVETEVGYEDYYIWHDGKIDENGTRVPPNNWISVWSNSAWEWNERRQQYYFHQYSIHQPDLNYRNEKVQQEMRDILTYWLDIGVDGFRIDAVIRIYEDVELKDEPKSGATDDPTDYNYLNHIYSKDQPETYQLIYDWRKFIDNYTNNAGGDTRILMTECTTGIEKVILYYRSADGSQVGAHFAFNLYLLDLNQNSNAANIRNVIKMWYDQLEPIYTYNWLTGNHDNHRVATKMGQNKVDAYNMLITFLQGVTITYNGEEIGQENGEVTCEQGQDPRAIEDCTTYAQKTRDFERTPFQWDNTTNAGFNGGNTTWLPVSSKYLETNLALEKDTDRSHFYVYQNLTKFKREVNGKNNDDVYYTFSSTDDELLLEIDRFNNNTNGHYSYIFNTGTTDKQLSFTKDFIVIVGSGDLDFQPGILTRSLVFKPGNSAILYFED